MTLGGRKPRRIVLEGPAEIDVGRMEKHRCSRILDAGDVFHHRFHIGKARVFDETRPTRKHYQTSRIRPCAKRQAGAEPEDGQRVEIGGQGKLSDGSGVTISRASRAIEHTDSTAACAHAQVRSRRPRAQDSDSARTALLLQRASPCARAASRGRSECRVQGRDAGGSAARCRSIPDLRTPSDRGLQHRERVRPLRPAES